MTAGRNLHPQPLPVLLPVTVWSCGYGIIILALQFHHSHRPPNPPLSSPVFTPTLLPPIDLPTYVESGPRLATVSNVTRRVHHDRRVPDPMTLVQNRTRDAPQPFSFESPVTPINDENDPGSIESNSRQAPSSSRSSQRRPLDKVPLSQLGDQVEDVRVLVITVLLYLSLSIVPVLSGVHLRYLGFIWFTILTLSTAHPSLHSSLVIHRPK